MNKFLTPQDWVVGGREIIAWINDLEFFDITYSGESGTFALRINHVGHVTTVYLGESGSVAEAQARANIHLGHNGPTAEFTCSHGRSLIEGCSECDALD